MRGEKVVGQAAWGVHIAGMKMRIAALAMVLSAPGGAAGEGGLPEYVREVMGEFYERRVARLETLEMVDVLGRKNPYLLKAAGISTAEELVEDLMDSHLAAQEPGLFGTVMEKLAIRVCAEAYGGRKSGIGGIDLEFEKGGTKYIVSVKSGPNWGNSGSIKAMEEDFGKAKRVLNTNTSGVRVVAVNGCCYGRTATEDKGGYLKLCGKAFWELISGDGEMYLKVHRLIGAEAEARRGEFEEKAGKVRARFVGEFGERFCDESGAILWDKLVEFNSGG